MLRVLKAYFKDIDELRCMKRGHNEEKKGHDALTPSGSPFSPRSPDDQGVNIDHGSQDEVAGDADVLPSTHVSDMSSIPKEAPPLNKHQPPISH